MENILTTTINIPINRIAAQRNNFARNWFLWKHEINFIVINKSNTRIETYTLYIYHEITSLIIRY